ncbi:MAG: RHS repeat domain-containing protein [Candidatus Nanopelagicales bacterium]|nr:RHS repeat domain-containing protein [Candidatus Nanopelagicales bacterium]
MSTGFDSWAQPTSYTDASGNPSSTTYDLAGRVSSRFDGKGTYTYTYDTPSEHRGLVTSMSAGIGGGLGMPIPMCRARCSCSISREQSSRVGFPSTR